MRKLWLHIVLLFVSIATYAQTYDFRNYNVEDGLTQSQVYCIFQDSRGYMWFGTNTGGVSKFDGKTFQNYTPENGLLSTTVYSIAEDKHQNLYFGTYDGLQIKGKFKDIRFDTSNGLPNNTVFKVLVDRTEKVWIGTQQGVCYLNENKKPIKFTGNKLLESSAIFTIYEDNTGNYWFGTIQNGACCYSPKNNTYTWYNQTNGLKENFIRSFNEDGLGNIYIGAVAGLYRVEKNKKIKAVVIPGMSIENMAVTCISKDKNNTFWLATNEGVVKYNGNIYHKFLVGNGLCGNLVLSSFVDSEGNLWFGSDGFGVSKLSSEVIVNYSEKDGLPGDYINSIRQTKDKKYWIGTRNNGLMTIKGNERTLYKVNKKNTKESLIDDNVNYMAEDKESKLWIGTQAGLSIFSENKFTNYWAETDYQTIYSIYHDSQGKHYLGTGNGLVIFGENGKKEPVEAVNKLKTSADLAIYCIEEDKYQNLWLATAAYGVIKYNGKDAEVINKKNKFTDRVVYSIVKDKDGNLWFATEEGVFYYDFKEFTNIGEKDGLISNQTCFLVFDNQNRLWIGTNKGIDALQVNDFVNTKKINLKHFGKEDGLKGIECNGNAAIKDDEGKLWFGTVKGVTIYNPRFEKTNYQEPSCLITDIKLFFEKADLSPYSSSLDSLSGLPVNLKLPYSKNHVTIDFIGISQTNPDKVKYQFKLEGVDGDWVPVTSKTEVTYSSLQPGNYTFYLKAMNNDGVWNKEPLQFKFKVLPPWYKTWWFYTICAIVALASIYGYNTYKTKKLYADKVKLEKEVGLRTRELREEKQKVELINKEVIEQKATIEHKNLEMTDSIKYAKNIQEALLPAITGLKKDFPESFVLYMPKDIVSGDFYWFANRDGKNLFAAADCTGHGVPGAFMSIIGNSLINEIVGEQHVYQPAEILNNLHIGVKTALNHNKGEFERRDGMDIALCAFNKENMILEYAGANRALWIYRKGTTDKAEIIKPDKNPIGGIEHDFEVKRQFTNHTIQLQKGDCVYVFSDGYADQFGGEKGKKFMVANLQRTFSEITHKSMEEQYEHLRKVFTDWRGAYEQIDDVLVIGVRV
jgi:ligand-binding sensor domain-containing protein/serine phosphatase RsbU (regulator of sigma subunit)